MTSFTSAATVTIGGLAYDPVSFTMTQDNNWTPVWQGSLVLPYSAAVAALDPTTYPRIRMQWWWGADGNGPYPRVMDANPIVRGVIKDRVNDTITLTVASGEVLLQDYKNAGADVPFTNPSLVSLFVYAMGKVGITSAHYSTAGIPAVTIPTAAATFKAGQSLDDWLRANLRANNCDIYEHYMDQDTSGPFMAVWNTDAATGKSPRNAGVRVNAVWGANITGLRQGSDMDNGGWADAAVAEYTWVSAGASQRKVYASSVGTYHKVQYVHFDSADPGFDPSPSIRNVALRLGQTAQVETYPGPSFDGGANTIVQTTVGDNHFLLDPDGVTWQSTVTRVEYAFPDDRMTTALQNTQVAFTPIAPLPLPLP